MINPGFFSFFNARRGMLAAQMSLDTVNQNISNANTEGYSRQRVDLSAFDAYTSPTNIYQDLKAGQLGQGVLVNGVSRVRDTFLDGQYRLQNSIFGSNTEVRNVLQQLEGILVEPSGAGINASMQEFFNAAQELSLNPQSLAVRADFLQHGVDLTTVFQQQGSQLINLQRQLVGDPAIPGSVGISALAINIQDANNKLTELANLNKEILTVQASGAAPNDLLDRRDLLLDKLSKIVEIDVANLPNGQITLDIAGQRMIQGVTLQDTLEVVLNPAYVPPTGGEPHLVQTVNGGVDIINGPVAPPATPIQSGQIKGIVDVAGRNTSQTSVFSLLSDLDLLLRDLVAQVNFLQLTGRDLNGNVPPLADPIFEVTPGAGFIFLRTQVDADVLNDPSLIAAAEGPPAAFLGPGDGENALAIAQLRDGAFPGLGGTGFVEFFNGVISSAGIDTRTFENRSESQEAVLHSLDLRRDSIAGVNMDEELIDLVRFQRAFEASSRTIQTFNEIYETIINMV